LRGSSSPFSPLSRRGLNPIKPVYDSDLPDGRLNLTASGFNQLGQYTSSPGRRATATQNSPFSSLAVVVTIASTHCAYPQRDGQAELAWVAGYVMRQSTCPKAVTDPNNLRTSHTIGTVLFQDIPSGLEQEMIGHVYPHCRCCHPNNPKVADSVGCVIDFGTDSLRLSRKNGHKLLLLYWCYVTCRFFLLH